MDSMISPAHSDDTLGGRIAEARDLVSLSAEEVASRIGVTVETFAEWENDRAEPRANKLVTLAGVLGVSPGWLLSGAGTGPEHSNFGDAIVGVSREIHRLRGLSGEIGAAIDALQVRLDMLAQASRDLPPPNVT